MENGKCPPVGEAGKMENFLINLLVLKSFRKKTGGKA
jgi:hypothetical protein